MSPHERNATHDSGFSQTEGGSTSHAGSNANGWTVKSIPAQTPADPIAPLSSAMSNMQVNGTSGGWNTSSNAQPAQQSASSAGGLGWGDENGASAPSSAAVIQPVISQTSGGGIGWGDEPASTTQASKPQTGSWELPTSSNGPSQQNGNNGYPSSRSSTFEDAAETVRPSDSVSNVNGDSRSNANGYANGYGNQSQSNGYSNGQTNGYGNDQSNPNGSYGYGSNSHNSSNVNGSYGGFSSNNGGSNNYNTSGDHGYNSGGGGGYSSGGGAFGGGGGGYGGGGPPQERRFPGPGGSWASGANEVPLRQNRWTLHANRRPGDDVHRPVVPQAIPGSGW